MILVNDQYELHTPSRGSGLAGSASAIVNMEHGHWYYSCVSAVDAAGHRSKAVCSSGVVYDNVPPEVGELIDEDGSRFLDKSTSLCVSWAGFRDTDSGLATLEWTLYELVDQINLLNASDVVPVPLNDPVLLNASESGYTCHLVNFSEGSTYFSHLIAADHAGMQVQVRSTGFTIDYSAPSPGNVSLDLVYPSRFDEQPGFPNNVTGITVIVAMDAFDDPQSGIASFEVHVTVVDNGDETTLFQANVSSAEVHIEIPLLIALVNGTTVYASVRARNPVHHTSDIVVAHSLVQLKAIQLGRIWILDEMLVPVSRYLGPSDVLAAAFQPAQDPMFQHPFLYYWELQDAPCGTGLSNSNVTHLGQTHGEPWQLDGHGDVLTVMAADAAAARTSRFCIRLTACTIPPQGWGGLEDASIAGRCGTALTVPVTYDATSPVVSIKGLPDGTSSKFYTTSAHVQMRVLCVDPESGIDALFISMGTLPGHRNLLNRRPVPLDAAASRANQSNESTSVGRGAGMLRFSGKVNSTHVSGIVSFWASTRRSVFNRSATEARDGATPFQEGTPIFMSLACISRAGFEAAAIDEEALILDTQPPIAGKIGLPALRWSEGLQAWVGPWLSSSHEPVLLDVALWEFGDEERQFSDEGIGLSHFELCVGTEPMVCDIEPKVVVDRDAETAQVTVQTREFHISVWAHDYTRKMTATSCRAVLDATPPVLGNLSLETATNTYRHLGTEPGKAFAPPGACLTGHLLLAVNPSIIFLSLLHLCSIRCHRYDL